MRIKVRGGTAHSGEQPLCDTCRFSTIIRGRRLGDEVVICDRPYPSQRLAFPVTSCTSYSDRRRASLREMEEIAWVLRSDPRRNQVGFVHPSRLEDDERFVLEEE